MQRMAYIQSICVLFVWAALHGAASSQPPVTDQPYALYAPREGLHLVVQTGDKLVNLQIAQQGDVISQTLILHGNQMLTENSSPGYKTPSPTPLSLMVSGNYPVALGKPSENIIIESTYARPLPFLFFGSSPALHMQLAQATKKLSSLTAVIKKMQRIKVTQAIIVVDLHQLLTQFYGPDWQNQLPWSAIPQYEPVTGSVTIVSRTRKDSADRMLKLIKKHRAKPIKSKSFTTKLNGS